MHAPAVTVLMPVLNGAVYIAEALDSIRRQTFQDFELLIIDDGCTDNSIEIVQSMKFPALRIIPGPRQGVGAALALGVNSSTSEFLARHDADDLSDPTRLEKQMAVMAKNPNCVIVGSWAKGIDANGHRLGTIKTPSRDRSIKTATNLFCPFVHTSVLLRKEAIIAAGNYGAGDSKGHAEDYDLWTRMVPLGEMCNLKETLVSYRIHQKSVTGEWTRLKISPGQSIALRTSQATLGRELRPAERRTFALFHNRTRRISLFEALGLYMLMLKVIQMNGFPPTLGTFSWRHWLLPLVRVIKEPRTNKPKIDSNPHD